MGQQGPDGQRPQSPSLSGDNAPSPSKRPRVDGFNPGMGGNPNGTGQVMNGQANIPLNADPSMMMANQLPGKLMQLILILPVHLMLILTISRSSAYDRRRGESRAESSGWSAR